MGANLGAPKTSYQSQKQPVLFPDKQEYGQKRDHQEKTFPRDQEKWRLSQGTNLKVNFYWKNLCSFCCPPCKKDEDPPDHHVHYAKTLYYHQILLNQIGNRNDNNTTQLQL